jgi:hypothetical protein
MSRITEAAAKIPPPRQGLRPRALEAFDALTPEEKKQWRGYAGKNATPGWLAAILTEATGVKLNAKMVAIYRDELCRE